MANDIPEDFIREMIDLAGGFDGLKNMLVAAGATMTYVDDGKDDLILKMGDVHLFTVHPDGSYSFPKEEPIDED